MCSKNGISIDGRQFPKKPSNLIKSIKTLIPSLKAAYGIIIEIGRSADNTFIITIYRKTATEDKPPSSGGSEATDANSTTFNIQDIKTSDKNHNVNRDDENVE